MLRLLNRLADPAAGMVRYRGRDLLRRGRARADAGLADLRLSAIGFVFQQFNLIPTLAAGQNVETELARCE